MSNQAPLVSNQPDEQNKQPKQASGSEQQAGHDALVRLANVDIPAEQRRLKQIKDPNAQQAIQEMSGTILDILKDTIRHLVSIRDWTFSGFNSLSDHMEAFEDRLDTVETYGSETSITQEDADVLAKAVIGCRLLATEFLQGPFPINERDEEGKQKLAELIAIAEQGEKIIDESTLSLEEGEDEDEQDDEDDPGPS